MKRILLGLALLALAPVAVQAQDYPSRTVTVIVPFPPGGSVDGVARIIVDRLNQAVAASTVVDGRLKTLAFVRTAQMIGCPF